MFGRAQRKKSTFDEFVEESLLGAMEQVVADGETVERASELAGEAYAAAMEQTAPSVAARLRRTAPRMLREHRRIATRFRRRGIRKHWGSALDSYYVYLVCAEEAGAQFNATRRPAAADAQDHLFEALTGLHARACRTAAEVHHLLSGGFPLGALARYRTLHELAVTAIILSEHGRQPEHAALAEKYLLHSTVMNWQDAKVFQEHAERLGEGPLGQDVLDEIEASRNTLVQRYGASYGRPYGWAADIAGPDPKFIDLERLADLVHLRSHYKWASHEVHADAKGWELNRFERGGVTYQSSGASNVGLADPAHLALISLHQTTAWLLTSAEECTPTEILVLKTLEVLLDEAGDALLAGHHAVEAAEERYQAREALRGSRWSQRARRRGP